MKTFIKSGFWTTKNTGATPKGWLDLTKLIEDNSGGASGYTPENSVNKSTSVTTDSTSNTKYPSVKAVFDWANSLFTTTSAVASQITTALAGYATQSFVNTGLATKQDKLQDTTGNIGVGKTDASATEKLDVNGNVKANGFKTLNGTANKSLTADGGTFDLNTKADLEGGKVAASQLPSYVDDVLEFANLASFPATGESGKIYIAIDTNITYRWSGTGYAEISSSLALGETPSTAYRGDRGKIAYDHSQVTHDKALVGLGNVDNTSDLNKPISTATLAALNLKLSTEAPSTTGTVISFSTDKVYGTLATPETGNITADITNAKLGVTNIIIHNSATAPTFGSQFKKLSGSGNYVTGVVNYIYCTYISTTEIIYSINQRA